MAKRWLGPKVAALRRAAAELRSLHRSQVSLYPDDGLRHVPSQGVTSPSIKIVDDATRALIDDALRKRKEPAQ